MTTGQLRNWALDSSCDKEFLKLLPAGSLKQFQKTFRPFEAEAATRMDEALFAGIKKPFHYTHTSGWMRRLLHSSSDIPESASIDERASMMRRRLGWPESDIVLLIYGAPMTYAGTWGSFLTAYRSGFINLHTMLICHPKHRETIAFWEEQGPIFGKRGSRELVLPVIDF